MLKQDMINNYTNLSLRKLDSEIRKNGFTYRLVKRTPERLMYSQHDGTDQIIAYEVFLNKLGDLRRAKQRWAKLQSKTFNSEDCEEFYEIFPSDEEFGERAWTYPNLELAQKAFDGLQISSN